MKIDTSGLENFRNNLNKAYMKMRGTSEDSILSNATKIAKKEIRTAYSSKPNIKIIVEKRKYGCTIYAKDYNTRPIIAFDEFGTGFYAKGSYPGKLPTKRISFHSAGQKRSTKGWQYYYPNSQTKVTHGGIKGWMVGKLFSIGHNANATMYRACKKSISKIKEAKL